MTDIINFKAGRYKISFEILNILMTEKYEGNATQVPSGDGTLLGVINYNKVPTPIYDLSMILEGTTAQKRMAELVEKLADMEQEHIDWLEELENAIEFSRPFTKPRDYKQSEFGKWHTSFDSENSDLLHMLTRFSAPLSDLYLLADKAIALSLDGQKEDALTAVEITKKTTLLSIRKLYEAARDSVTASHKPVIVYTTSNGTSPNLGFLVDSVDESLTISESDIQSFQNDSAIQFAGNLNLPTMIAGLITKDNINSLLIDPNSVAKELPEQLTA